MEKEAINKYLQGLIDNSELASAGLIVRKNGEVVYQNKFGYQSIEKKTPIAYNSIYRMMSMTKCITGVAVMKLIEEGKIDLDAPISQYIPEFSDMQVSADERYVYDPQKLKKKMLWYMLTFKMEKVKTEPANREITIRDLLSHSSGLEQGVVGLLAMIKMKPEDKTLKERVMRYTNYVLGFQPGTDTGYSPLAGFDVLGYIIEIVTGKQLEAYLREEIFTPLEMPDTTFFLTEEQKTRLVDVYQYKKGKLINVTGTKGDMSQTLRQEEITFEQGSGGLFSTITDYEHFAEMLCNEGSYHGKQILKKETVALMHTEAQSNHLEPDPGMVWGLSVKIRQNPKKAQINITEGTYGWSGAFGTHFFVSPKDKMEAVFVANRSDLGGSGSYISKKIEELVFEGK